MKKKIVSLLLALTMMVGLLPAQALAAGDGSAADTPAVTEPAGEEQMPTCLRAPAAPAPAAPSIPCRTAATPPAARTTPAASTA